MANTVNTLTAELGKLLSVLAEVLQGSAQAKALVNALGWELPPGVDDIGLAGLNLTDFLEKLRIVLESSEEEWEERGGRECGSEKGVGRESVCAGNAQDFSRSERRKGHIFVGRREGKNTVKPR